MMKEFQFKTRRKNTTAITRGINTFLCVSILLTYYQVFHFDFIAYDTLVYVTNNTIVQAGISINNIRWALNSSFFSNWHPLTWISYMIDMELWGLNPVGFHATNLLLHTCNSLLLFKILQKTTNKLWESGFVAGLFALHPMHIESVAWIAERKDVLSAFFFFLAILSYIKYVKNQTLFTYTLTLVSFFLAIMSKSMVVTFPAVLLLLDYWPLRRFKPNSPSNRHCTDSKKTEKNHYQSIILEKIPFFILAAIGSQLTLLAQHNNLTPLEGLPLTTRLASALTSYPAYIEKTFWPVKLGILYPHHGMPNLLQLLGAILILLTITFFFIQWRHARPWLIVGWLWFLGTLLPVIGIIHVGHHFIADRYTYIPHVGVFIIIAWGISEICKTLFPKHNIFVIIACCLLIASSAQSWQQLKYWENDQTLWTRTLEITHNNYIAENNLGTALLNNNFPDKAQQHFQRAIIINKYYAEAYSNLAFAQARQGQFDKSINNYQLAISINPDVFLDQYRIAEVYLKSNMPQKAITYFKNALTLRPHSINTAIHIGDLLYENGQIHSALEIYKSIAQREPANTGIQQKILSIERTKDQR